MRRTAVPIWFLTRSSPFGQAADRQRSRARGPSPPIVADRAPERLLGLLKSLSGDPVRVDLDARVKGGPLDFRRAGVQEIRRDQRRAANQRMVGGARLIVTGCVAAVIAGAQTRTRNLGWCWRRAWVAP